MRFFGFSASDFIEFFAALSFSSRWHGRRWVEPYGRRLAQKTVPGPWCCSRCFPSRSGWRCFPQYPIPTPNVSDDFSYLLIADTLRHFHLANPAHPLHQFFETFFVLQQPTYASIFPLGQGLILGWTSSDPWAGVALSIGALCALCYWMLRAWTSPGWALVGGLLAVIEFGPLNQWMNSYWGGAVAACAGCLVFGSLPRLIHDTGRSRYAVLLGLGIGIHWLCRPYETAFLILSVVLFLLPNWRSLAKPAVWLTACHLPGDRTIAAAKSSSHRQLDDAALSTQPVSIRRANHLHRAATPCSAPAADARAATRLRHRNPRSTAPAPTPSPAIGGAGPAGSPSIASSFSRRLLLALPAFFLRLRE